MKKIILSFLITLTLPAVAEIVPDSSPKDQRVQTVVYDADNVINVYTKIGHTTLIQLEEDERIEGETSGLGLGDSAAWSLGVRGNNILLKPAAELPTTNMTIITNKRTYLFSLLQAKHTNNARTHRPVTYILRFDYPDTKARLEQERRERQARADEKSQLALIAQAPKSDHNINYYMWGDTMLAPTYAWDDGRFTYLRYPDARSLPAVFKVLPDGREAVVNQHIEGDTIVIHETAETFYLRFGSSVLGILNKGHDPYGTFNHTGTTVDNLLRVERN